MGAQWGTCDLHYQKRGAFVGEGREGVQEAAAAAGPARPAH